METGEYVDHDSEKEVTLDELPGEVSLSSSDLDSEESASEEEEEESASEESELTDPEERQLIKEMAEEFGLKQTKTLGTDEDSEEELLQDKAHAIEVNQGDAAHVDGADQDGEDLHEYGF